MSGSPSSAEDRVFRFRAEQTVAARYEIVTPLESLDMGEIYRAVSETTRFPVNVRYVPLPVGDEELDSLRAAGGGDSRFLTSVLDARPAEGGLFVVTEPYPSTLSRRLAEKGALAPEVAGDRFAQLLLALEELERRALYPLCICPEAVACWEDAVALDEYWLPLLSPPGRRPVLIERARYLAPDLDPRAPRPEDALYGLGMTLCEMLTGRPLVEGSPFEMIIRAARGEIRPPLGGPLGAVVAKLLAPRASNRYASARQVIDDLARDREAVGGPDSGIPAVVELQDSGPTRGTAVDAGARLEPAGLTEGGLEIFVRQPDEVRMVLLPGGRFLMGGERGRPDEAPPLEIELDPFLIDEAPVTWGALLKMLERAGEGTPAAATRAAYLPLRMGGRRAPDWRWEFDQEVEQALSALCPATNLTFAEVHGLVRACGLNLPSEAEWEYACRAGTRTDYPWGDAFDEAYAWISSNSEGRPHPVGGKLPNRWGLFDMCGNVAEMCRDFFHKDAYARAAAGDGLSRADVAAGIVVPSDYRSLRGGSFLGGPAGARSAARARVDVTTPSASSGFRCVVRSVDAPDWARAAFEG